ncbi:MAG: Flp pilus assembly protein CpaB [Anaerolineae bacterium]|nr:Flp pilus assembly protein CpaB [Anaerolineae bacterium]
MNDHHLLEKIERRIQSEQSVDDVVIDGLADSMPHTRPGFQQNLEDQLLARYQPQGAAIMTPIASAPRKPRIALPLTLAAALLAVVFVASLLMFVPPQPSGISGMHLTGRPTITPTNTPTPMPTSTPIQMVRILISYQNIPRGYRFPATVDELHDIVGYVDWPLSAVPFNALIEGQNGLEQLLGKVLLADVFREQPVMNNMVGDELPANNFVEGDLRPVVIALENLPRGTRINEDVAAQLGVVYWPAAIAPDTAYADVADLDGQILYNDVQQWQPILQDDVIADSASMSPDNAAAITLPSNKVAVSIPINVIESVSFGLQEGDRVNVMATMLFIDAENQYQVMTTPDASSQPRVMTQQIAESAVVVFIGRLSSDSNATPLPTDIVTLAVSPEEGIVLTWAIEAMLPLTFVTAEADTTPTAADVYRQLGFRDYQQRNYEGAVENFTQCANLGSDNINCYFLRGLAHYYLGNCDDAWNVLQDSLVRVQTLTPQEPVLSITLEGLKLVQRDCPAYADKIITDNPVVGMTPTLGN